MTARIRCEWKVPLRQLNSIHWKSKNTNRSSSRFEIDTIGHRMVLTKKIIKPTHFKWLISIIRPLKSGWWMITFILINFSVLLFYYSHLRKSPINDSVAIENFLEYLLMLMNDITRLFSFRLFNWCEVQTNRLIYDHDIFFTYTLSAKRNGAWSAFKQQSIRSQVVASSHNGNR